MGVSGFMGGDADAGSVRGRRFLSVSRQALVAMV